MSGVALMVGSVVVLLGGLIFVHELGHFVVAKLFNVKVIRFSLGFGPRLFGFRRGETEYRVALLPLGGYVKMAGDDPTEELAPEDRGRGFLEQKPWRRFLIALAGPAFNLIFPAVLFFSIILAQNGTLRPGTVVGTISPHSPAEGAGLRPGDRIVAVQGRNVRWFGDLSGFVSPHPDEPLDFAVQRGEERLSLRITPARQEDTTPIETRVKGVVGVSPFYPASIVAPVVAGAAGALEPFDVVVKAGGKPIAHWGQLDLAARAAGCGPIDLLVLREKSFGVPGAALSTWVPLELAGVPTCANGQPSFAPSSAMVSTFVAAVAPRSPAAEAGLKRGDRIESVNGRKVVSYADMTLRPGETVTLGLAGGRSVSLAAAEVAYHDELTGENLKRTVVGFERDDRLAPVLSAALIAEQVPVRFGAVEAAQLAVSRLTEVVRVTVLGIARLFQRRISFATVGGPIMLIRLTAQAAEEGLESFLRTMALISVNLGLMNLLPIPVLDGGHIVTCLVEAVTRRPLSIRTREIANVVGLLLLITLMIFVFRNDIVKLVG